MKRRLVGFILSFALLGGTIGCSTDSNRPGQGSGNDSLGQWIRQIPQAEAGEFPTPEAVIHAFIEAVNDNDYDNALKCFPIAQYVEAYTLEVHYKSRLSYSPEDPSDPLPLNDAHNFLLLFTGYHAIWNQFFNTLLMDSHPELEGFEIVKDDPEAQNKLDQLESMELTSKFSVLNTKEVEGMQMGEVHKAMHIEERKTLETQLKIGDERTAVVYFFVDRIGTNWFITNARHSQHRPNERYVF